MNPWVIESDLTICRSWSSWQNRSGALSDAPIAVLFLHNLASYCQRCLPTIVILVSEHAWTGLREKSLKSAPPGGTGQLLNTGCARLGCPLLCCILQCKSTPAEGSTPFESSSAWSCKGCMQTCQAAMYTRGHCSVPSDHDRVLRLHHEDLHQTTSSACMLSVQAKSDS